MPTGVMPLSLMMQQNNLALMRCVPVLLVMSLCCDVSLLDGQVDPLYGMLGGRLRASADMQCRH